MIDFQRDFCAAGGYSDRFAGLEWVRPIIAPARRLLDAARRAGHLVVHTREGYAPDLSDCSPAKLQRSRNAGSEIGSRGPMGRLLIRGEHGHDIIDELAPVAGEIVVDKASYGAFCGTNLERILRGRGDRHPGPGRRHRRRLRPHDAARGLRPLVRLPLRRRRDLLLRPRDPQGLREDDRGRGRHLGHADQRRGDHPDLALGASVADTRRPSAVHQPAPVGEVVVRPELGAQVLGQPLEAPDAGERQILAHSPRRRETGARARSPRPGSPADRPRRRTGSPAARRAARPPASGAPACVPGCRRFADPRTATPRRARKRQRCRPSRSPAK